MWAAWAAGNRKEALEVIPDEVTDALVLHGSFGSCREQILAYCEAGFAERRICDVQLLLAKPRWAAKAGAEVHSAEIAATG